MEESKRCTLSDCYIIDKICSGIKYIILIFFKYISQIISLILSIICFTYIFYSKNCVLFTNDSNGYSILVSVLSVIVTLLLGWQIFTSISTKKDIEDLKLLKHELGNRIEREIKKVEGNAFQENMLLSTLLLGISSSEKKRSITSAFNVFSCSNKNSISNNLAFEYIVGCISSIINEGNKKFYLDSMSTYLDYKEVENVSNAISNGEHKEVKCFLGDLMNKIKDRS